MTCTKDGSTWTAKTIEAMTGNLADQNYRAWSTLTIQPAEAQAIDTYTRESSADTNYALSTNFAIQGTANQRRIIMLKFDLTGIPVGATIQSATLSMTNDAAIATGTVTISRMLAANSAWTEAGATWNYAVASTTRWAGDTGGDGGADAGCSVSGTDYSSTAMGTFTMTVGDPDPTEYSAALNLTEFDTMLANNYGMVLTTNANNTNNLYSSGATTAGNRPKLVVVYENP